MKLLKNLILSLLAAALAVPAGAARKTVIPVETAHTQLVLVAQENGVLQSVHFGAKIADPSAFGSYRTGRGMDNGEGPMAYPTTGGRYLGQPALHVKYADGYHNTELVYVDHQVVVNGNVVTTKILLKDPVTSLEVGLIYDAYQKEDVICAHSEIRNAGMVSVELRDYASGALYLDADRYYLTHFHGGWADEMQMEGELLTHDTKVIESRRGTQVTQCNNPSFLVSLNADRLQENVGEVVAGALAWSGNFRLSFEMDESNRLTVLAGINPFASTYELASGKVFETPEFIYTYSGRGAGQASRNLHAWARNYGVYGGGQINPTLLNSWEGAYFSFTTETLLRMIDDAAAMGLEMFVLDDGWFAKDYPRNGDNAGLGDWEVNTAKIPEGIDYVASYAHGKGLKFGIWIEPEMVNPQSNLAHAHPEWVVQSPGREIYQSRNQWVLDLGNPAVQDFVYGIFDKTMQLAPNIDYIKWDCNRTVYNVMRRLRAKYPHTIVQCCSSGGGRVDYGALKYFNEIWTSDNTDAFTRAYIQYATNLIYPACVMASHVSAVPNHQTGNVTPLKFRFDMACSGRLGMELQPRNLSEGERALADRCIRSYKEYRDLVFTGDVYRLASPYEGDYYALMYVSQDQRRAVVFAYCLKYQNRAVGSHPFRLDGLDPARRYKVTELNVNRSSWWGSGQVHAGDFLMNGGFNPVLLKTFDSGVFYLEAD